MASSITSDSVTIENLTFREFPQERISACYHYVPIVAWLSLGGLCCVLKKITEMALPNRVEIRATEPNGSKARDVPV